MEKNYKLIELCEEGEVLKGSFNESYGHYAYDLYFGKRSSNLESLKMWINKCMDIIQNLKLNNDGDNILNILEEAYMNANFLNKDKYNKLLNNISALA